MHSTTNSVLLVHHAASRGHRHCPNSLGALHHCLRAKARVVELDIVPLVNVDFALLHDERLEKATSGQGVASAITAAQLQQLYYVCQSTASKEPVGLLSQALSRVSEYPLLKELQLDLKPYVPLTATVLNDLLQLIAPIREKIRVISMADWALRRLRSLDSGLLLGFDPLLYLDVRTEIIDPSSLQGVPPFRQGAYGYWDDHPLSARRWGSTADYLAARAEALYIQVPADTLWSIRASLLSDALNEGFDWIAYLHDRGSQVSAWTLDADQLGDLAIAQHLASAQIDRIVTNNAPLFAAALDGPAEF